MHFRLAPRLMTLDDLELETTYFLVLGENILQTVCTTVVRLPLRQLGILVFEIRKFIRILKCQQVLKFAVMSYNMKLDNFFDLQTYKQN